MGILDALLGSNPGILASLFGGGTPSLGIAPGSQPDIQGPSAPPGGVPSIPGNAVPWGQGGLLGNGIIGNAARGALYGLGAAGQPGPKGFLTGVGRGAQQSIGMMDARRAADERASYLQMQQQQMAMNQRQQQAALEAAQQLAETPPAGMDPDQWRAIVMANPDAASQAQLRRMFPDLPSGYQAGQGGGLQPIPGGPEDPATKEANARLASKYAWHELAPGAVGGYGLGAGTDEAPAAAPSNPVFSAAEQKYGLPPGSVAAIASVESGGQGQRARSPAGAIGTMQLMPGTAKEMGANPYDTEQNIDAGAGYFAGLLKKYKGDVPTALAAYNAGPGRVDSWILAGRPQSGKGALPAETQAYVPKVLARMQGGQPQQVPQGGIVRQGNTVTNMNPRPGQAQWVPINDAQGNPIGQRDLASGKVEYNPQGITVTMKDGVPSVQIGGRNITAPGMTQAATTQVNEKLIALTDTRMQIQDMIQRFNPSWQEIPTRAGMAWSSLKDRFGGLDPAAKQQLQDYTQYRASVGQNFTAQLKVLSGVAVNPSEFKRAEIWLPNAGTGIFDGDSPTELKSKMDRLNDFTNKAIAKYHYITQKGISIDDVDVDQMPKIMNDRGKELEGIFAQRGYQGDRLQQAVRGQLAAEFGLVSR